GHGGAVLACPLGDLFVGEAELAVEALEGVGHLDGVEVLALDVLDERDLHQAVVGEFLDDDGNLVKAGHAGGSEAALASDELVGVAVAADDQRLDDAILANGLRELLEALWRESGAR